MTERGSGWKASVDGVVSEFDEVTRHLRRRQRQALRVAWSVVAASGLGMAALIVLNLAPAGYQGSPITSSPSQSFPEGQPPPVPTPPADIAQPSAPAVPPAIVATAPVPVSTAPGPRRHPSHFIPPLAPRAPAVPAVPVTPPAPPAPPPAQPPAAPGLVDGLISGVLHLLV
jgi:hypothetical protein